ncbi:hypothetical protein DUI87_17761 [Hirundo rustica rustica]|uniref:Uncharacterized protein n=1 Tax=Hirundo rustica rustica TaxID=333673 RepID=A0A3M0JXG7_HIRRU|nr:hypothetical protein DUI87_17761 [Hirundo rustica rustica]
MMPGETPLASAGTAAAGGVCANCSVLQQVGTDRRPGGAGMGFLLTDENIHEYVAALLALKQKMIDGESHFREISALRYQVEKLLQKILPLEKCQEELGSLKAELEEKKVCL